MKFEELPLGARFRAEGQQWIKAGPKLAAKQPKGTPEFFPAHWEVHDANIEDQGEEGSEE